MGPQARTIETDVIDMPAHWASYLINGDASGFDYSNTPADPDAGDRELAACDAYVQAHVYAHGWRIVGCSDETEFGRFEGFLTDLLTYSLLRCK